MRKICRNCDIEFRTGSRIQIYCSIKCYHDYRKKNNIPNAGAFKGGHRAWNKGLKGIHLSPNSEWTKANYIPKKYPLLTVTERSDGRKYIKVREPNVWIQYSKYLWEQANKREVPGGYVVHHIDFDMSNDSLGNLILLSRAEHAKLHMNLRIERGWNDNLRIN